MNFFKQGQAGIEYVMLIAILLFFLIPTIYYSLNEANTTVKISQIDNAIRRLVRAADAVHALGPGAIEIITVTLPEGIDNITVEGSSILLEATLYGGGSDVHYVSQASLVGALPTDEGTYNIRVESMKIGVVNITQRT